MSRSDRLPAKLYARARCGIVAHEGFLEDALAAALGEPGVWAQLRVAHPAWHRLPDADPTAVVTQLVTAEGRADIHLRWAGLEELVIELKPWAPPSAAQMQQYVAGHPAALVTAIAQWGADYVIDGVLPMTTWGALRRLSWPGEPSAWRQLRHLIDAVGTAMPNLDPAALAALVPAWDAFDRVGHWFGPAVSAVQHRLAAAGASWVLKEGKERPGIEDAHRRLGRWVWPPPWKDGENFGLFIGLFAGNTSRDRLSAGVPDLRFMLNLNHEGARAKALWSDGAFQDAVHRWELRQDAVAREASSTWWFLLDARQPLDVLLGEADHGEAFKRWMLARTEELIDDGILARLVAVKP
ncbi:MAG: hypothetical protein Q8P41_18405 [Pseudomonadota bacterium]|nr:hypothetical protein [Pseudomonadota bacterium]